MHLFNAADNLLEEEQRNVLEKAALAQGVPTLHGMLLF